MNKVHLNPKLSTDDSTDLIGSLCETLLVFFDILERKWVKERELLPQRSQTSDGFALIIAF